MHFDYRKNVQLLTYLAQKEWWLISYMKALKLIFFADKYFLRNYGRTISWDSYAAMKHWPVAMNTYQIIQDIDISKEESSFDNVYIKEYLEKHNYDIANRKAPNLDFLAKREIQVLDMIYNSFGKYNKWELVNKTHDYTEWKQYENDIKVFGKRNIHIEDFFKNSEKQDRIFDAPLEDLQLVKDIFLEENGYV